MSDKPKLYALRAYHTETFDDSDYGPTEIGVFYRDVKFSHNYDSLNDMAKDLNKGYKNNYWTLKRTNELCKLDAEYEDYADSEYRVDDISEIFD